MKNRVSYRNHGRYALSCIFIFELKCKLHNNLKYVFFLYCPIVASNNKTK